MYIWTNHWLAFKKKAFPLTSLLIGHWIVASGKDTYPKPLAGD